MVIKYSHVLHLFSVLMLHHYRRSSIPEEIWRFLLEFFVTLQSQGLVSLRTCYLTLGFLLSYATSFKGCFFSLPNLWLFVFFTLLHHTCQSAIILAVSSTTFRLPLRFLMTTPGPLDRYLSILLSCPSPSFTDPLFSDLHRPLFLIFVLLFQPEKWF